MYAVTVRENVQSSMREWVDRMQNESADPFWMYPASEQPLDPNRPRVDITLDHFKVKLEKYFFHQKICINMNFLGSFGFSAVEGSIEKFRQNLVGHQDD